MIPGGVDPSTYLLRGLGSAPLAEDLAASTRAAVAGGTTTVADLVLSERGESLLDAFATWKTSVEESSCCDVVLSVAVPEVTDERNAEMEKLAKEGQRRQMSVCAKWHWSFFPPRGQAHPEHGL